MLIEDSDLVIAALAVEFLGTTLTVKVLLTQGLPADPELDCSTSWMSLQALTLAAATKLIPGTIGDDGAVMVAF